MRSKDFRKEAFEALKGKWLETTLCTFIYQSLASIAVVITIIILFIGMFSITGVMKSDTMFNEYLLNEKKEESLLANSEKKIFISSNKKTENKQQVKKMSMIPSIKLFNSKEIQPLAVERRYNVTSTDDTSGSLNSMLAMMLLMMVTVIVGAILAAIAISLAFIGYNRIYINVIMKKDYKPQVGDLFEGKEYWKKCFGLVSIMSLSIFLWSLLFIIPGIIKMYSYAMAPYILAENPEMRIGDCLKASECMMKGNKGKLCLLQLSFIGWAILLSLVSRVAILATIGSLLYTVYVYASQTRFYVHISGKEYKMKNDDELEHAY